MTVLSLELGTTHHDKGLDRSGRGAAPTRPLRSRAADDRVPQRDRFDAQSGPCDRLRGVT